MKMYQCLLKRNSSQTIGWISERGATVGNTVELLFPGGSSEFWLVSEVYTPGMDEKVLHEKQKLDRNSLPSLNKEKV